MLNRVSGTGGLSKCTARIDCLACSSLSFVLHFYLLDFLCDSHYCILETLKFLSLLIRDAVCLCFLKNILLEMLQAPVIIYSDSLGVMHTLNQVSPSPFTV